MTELSSIARELLADNPRPVGYVEVHLATLLPICRALIARTEALLVIGDCCLRHAADEALTADTLRSCLADLSEAARAALNGDAEK